MVSTIVVRLFIWLSAADFRLRQQDNHDPCFLPDRNVFVRCWKLLHVYCQAVDKVQINFMFGLDHQMEMAVLGFDGAVSCFFPLARRHRAVRRE